MSVKRTSDKGLNTLHTAASFGGSDGERGDPPAYITYVADQNFIASEDVVGDVSSMNKLLAISKDSPDDSEWIVTLSVDQINLPSKHIHIGMLVGNDTFQESRYVNTGRGQTSSGYKEIIDVEVTARIKVIRNAVYMHVAYGGLSFPDPSQVGMVVNEPGISDLGQGSDVYLYLDMFIDHGNTAVGSSYAISKFKVQKV